MQSHFSELHDGLLNDTIDDSFFEFTGDLFKGISSYFVNNTKKTEYRNDVVMAITDTASEYLDDCNKARKQNSCKIVRRVDSTKRRVFRLWGQKEGIFCI